MAGGGPDRRPRTRRAPAARHPRRRRSAAYQPGEPLLLPREVAPLLGVTPKALGKWAREGRLTYVAVPGGHRRYPRGEVVRVLRKARHADPEGVVDAVLHRRQQRE